MRRRTLTLAALAAALAAPALAAAPGIEVTAAWARPTPPGATTGAVYVVVTNRGRSADALVSASSPAAARVEFHVMSMAGGVMSMRPMALPATLAPGATLTFAPGGAHIMLTGLKAPLAAGAHVPLTLTFRTGGAVRVDALVGYSQPAGHGMHGMHM
jgi:hypothetical protein